MKLVLQNIGMLKNAELNLKKLSVIAGENDNGKSTVGKIVFCIIKAISRYKEDLQESKEDKTNEIINQLFFFLRREMDLLKLDREPLAHLMLSITNEDLLLTDRLETISEIIKIIEFDLKDPVSLEAIKKTFAKAILIANEPEDIKKSVESALRKVFASEFDSSILLHGQSEGLIQLYDGDFKLIDIKVFSDNKIELLNDIQAIELKDATFIESPLILNNHDLLIRSQSGLDLRRRSLHRLGIPYTTLHTKDLFDKLTGLPVGDFLSFLENDDNVNFKDTIKNIINGDIEYDRTLKNFVFVQNSQDLPIKNTASGVKTFGILQLLSANGFINKNSILIFDEPENHLHPKWQLNLAEIIVNLAKNGVHILISSHSPYIVEAIKRYSDKADLKNDVGFYLAEDNSIENKNNLETIFSKLAEPFAVFRSMDRDSLRDD